MVYLHREEIDSCNTLLNKSGWWRSQRPLKPKCCSSQEVSIMTNTELAEKINGYLKGSKTKAKKYEDLVVANFTILEEDGDVYVEVKDGVLTVAPYHYDDLQVNVTGSAENIDKLFAGEVAFEKAMAEGLVKVDGDVAKFLALEPLVPAKKAEKKPVAEKKPAEKKPAAPAAKTETKAAAPAAKPEVKPAVPAAKPEVKPVAPAAKPEVKAAPAPEKKPEVKAAAPAPKAKKHGKK